MYLRVNECSEIRQACELGSPNFRPETLSITPPIILQPVSNPSYARIHLWQNIVSLLDVG